MQQETMRGSLFPLFPLRVKCHNHERVPVSPISPILVANVYSSCQDMDHQYRGNRDPLSVFPWWSAKTMRGSLFPLFPLRVKCQNHERVPISPILFAHVLTRWQGMDHQNRGNRGIGTLSWFWHFTLRGNRGNRDPLMVLEESRYVCGYVLTFFGDWLVHASDVMVAMDENMYD